MSEVIVRQLYDGEDPDTIWQDYGLMEIEGGGESTIWDIFDNDGRLYLHTHTGMLKEGVTHPYPKQCEVKTWAGGFEGCDIEAIEKSYKEGK